MYIHYEGDHYTTDVFVFHAYTYRHTHKFKKKFAKRTFYHYEEQGNYIYLFIMRI